MITEDQVTRMKKAISQAIKVLGDRFGSTDGDVARSIQELKASLQPSQDAATATVPTEA